MPEITVHRGDAELVLELDGTLYPKDAIYGSAAYLPIAEGTRYEVTLGQAGLIARPKTE